MKDDGLKNDGHDVRICDCESCKLQRRATGKMIETPIKNLGGGVQFGIDIGGRSDFKKPRGPGDS